MLRHFDSLYDFVVVDAGSTLSPCAAVALHVSDEVHPGRQPRRAVPAQPAAPARPGASWPAWPRIGCSYVLNRTSDVEVVAAARDRARARPPHRPPLEQRLPHRGVGAQRRRAAVDAPRPARCNAELDTFARALAPSSWPHEDSAASPQPGRAAYSSAAYSAVTLVVMPPRAVKSPTTVIRRGRHAADQVVEDLVGRRPRRKCPCCGTPSR